MKTFVLVCVLIALTTCAVVEVNPAPAVLCIPKSSVWTMPNYPMPGNTVTFTFERRINCLHYFRITSPCTKYEVTYTTTHSATGAPPFTINTVTQHWINLIGCPSGMIAILEGNIVNAFPPSRTAWYHLFTAPARVHWGGFVANWASGSAQKVWFS